MIPYLPRKLSRSNDRLASLPAAAAAKPRPTSTVRALSVVRQLLDLVRCQVGIDPPGRNLRNSLRPNLDLPPAGGQPQHNAVEDIVLLVAQQPLRPADLVAGLPPHGGLLRPRPPGHLLLFGLGHLPRPPTGERSGEGELVGIFQLPADRQAVR